MINRAKKIPSKVRKLDTLPARMGNTDFLRSARFALSAKRFERFPATIGGSELAFEVF